MDFVLAEQKHIVALHRLASHQTAYNVSGIPGSSLMLLGHPESGHSRVPCAHTERFIFQEPLVALSDLLDFRIVATLPL
jgi:hypothetical protein